MSFLSLPDELLLSTASHLPPASAARLSQTCRRVHSSTVEVLFTNAEVSGYYDMRTFCRVLHHYPDRAARVKKLGFKFWARSHDIAEYLLSMIRIPVLKNCAELFIELRPTKSTDSLRRITFSYLEALCWASFCPKLQMLHVKDLCDSGFVAPGYLADPEELGIILPKTLTTLRVDNYNLTERCSQSFWWTCGWIRNLVISISEMPEIVVEAFNTGGPMLNIESLTLVGQHVSYTLPIYTSTLAEALPHLKRLRCPDIIAAMFHRERPYRQLEYLEVTMPAALPWNQARPRRTIQSDQADLAVLRDALKDGVLPSVQHLRLEAWGEETIGRTVDQAIGISKLDVECDSRGVTLDVIDNRLYKLFEQATRAVVHRD